MTEGSLITDVRELSSRASVIDLKGDVTASPEALADAYTRARQVHPDHRPQLQRPGVHEQRRDRMLVTLLVRANRQRQRLVAFGLNEHYRQIFELTRLDEAIGTFDTEAEAFAEADAP